MSNTLQKMPTAEPAAVQEKLNEKWAEVRQWVNDSAKFQHASLCCQVMAGFSLGELREHYGITQGKRTDINFPHDAGSWPELVKQHAGISDDTARRWIDMARGVKALWKKLPAREKLKALMSVPPSQWTDDDSKLIADATHKITDGRTQLEFMMDLGCCKKPPGNPNAKGTGSRALSISEKADAEKILVEDCMNRILMDLNTLAGRFTVVSAPDLEIFDGALMKHHAAIRQWLKDDHAKPADIAKLFQRL
jgi:hypothetical protein